MLERHSKILKSIWIVLVFLKDIALLIETKISKKNHCAVTCFRSICCFPYRPGLLKNYVGLVGPGPISFRNKLKISSYLSLENYKCTILYLIFWLIITSSYVALKTVWIPTSQLLQNLSRKHFCQLRIFKDFIISTHVANMYTDGL